MAGLLGTSLLMLAEFLKVDDVQQVCYHSRATSQELPDAGAMVEMIMIPDELDLISDAPLPGPRTQLKMHETSLSIASATLAASSPHILMAHTNGQPATLA